MGRNKGSSDLTKRKRKSRRGAWQGKFLSQPLGYGTLKVDNIALRVLAAMERVGDQAGVSVQDVLRQHLDHLYPMVNTDP